MLITLYVLIAIFLFLVIIGWNKGVPVLRYTQVNPLASVTPEEFEKELSWLKEKGYTTYTIAEWYQLKKLPSKSIVLTFDEGFYDNYLYVFPLLKKYNMKATFFLHTAYLPSAADRHNTVIRLADKSSAEITANFYKTGKGASEQYLSHEEIREMQASGLCDFQAHSHSNRVVFKKPEFIRYVKVLDPQAEDFHLYGNKAEDGFPVFRVKGETSIKAFIPNIYYARSVQEMLKEEWHELLEWQQRVEAAAFGVAAELNDMGRYETDDEFRQRVKKEISLNKEEIKMITDRVPVAYAWPYGHSSAEGKSIIEEEGIKIFLTRKNGTNASRPNWSKLRRITLTNLSIKAFGCKVRCHSHRLSGFLLGLFC